MWSTIAYANSYIYSDTDSYRHGNSYGYVYGNSDSHSDIDSYGYDNSDNHSDSDSYIQSCGHCHSDSCFHSDGNYTSVANANRDSHCHRNSDGSAESNAYFNTVHGACGSKRTSRNQSDFQQLYRELAQRGRCDRLSVGRSYRLIFHQLRSRLSQFGRQKCDQLPRDGLKSEHDSLLPSASLQWMWYKPQFQRQKCKDTAVHAWGSERAKRNQCDLEQFHRALAQRGRCDQLPVGRGH
jgi:hypothetical protein